MKKRRIQPIKVGELLKLKEQIQGKLKVKIHDYPKWHQDILRILPQAE